MMDTLRRRFKGQFTINESQVLLKPCLVTGKLSLSCTTIEIAGTYRLISPIAYTPLW